MWVATKTHIGKYWQYDEMVENIWTPCAERYLWEKKPGEFEITQAGYTR